MCLGLVCLHDSEAWAQRPTLILVDTPSAVREATSAALGTWHVEYVPAAIPPSDDGSHFEGARMLATERGATAVAWLLRDDADGSVSLCVYRHDRHQIASRRLDVHPPYTDGSAVSIALTLKTLLQNNGLWLATEAISGTGRVPLARSLGLSAGLSATANGEWIEPRLALSVEWGPFQAPVALASHLAMGRSRSVAQDDATASFSELSLGVAVRGATPLALGIEGIAEAGASLHRTRFAIPSASGGDEPFMRMRWNPGASLGVRMRRPIGWHLSAELSAMGGYHTHTQTYYDLDATILRTSNWSVDVGIGLHMAIEL